MNTILNKGDNHYVMVRSPMHDTLVQCTRCMGRCYMHIRTPVVCERSNGSLHPWWVDMRFHCWGLLASLLTLQYKRAIIKVSL